MKQGKETFLKFGCINWVFLFFLKRARVNLNAGKGKKKK